MVILALNSISTDSHYKKSIAQVAGKVKSFPINYGLAEKVGAKHWDRQDAIAAQDVVSHTPLSNAQKTGFSEKPVFYSCTHAKRGINNQSLITRFSIRPNSAKFCLLLSADFEIIFLKDFIQNRNLWV